MADHSLRFTLASIALLTTALTAITSLACATSPIHVVEKGVTYKHQAPLPEMELRIEEAAAEYRQYAPVPRFTLFDIAFPSDRGEWASTGYNAVLVVTALSQEAEELPVVRTFVRNGGTDTELRLLASFRSVGLPTSNAATVFGAHRWGGIYLLPTSLVAHRSELMVDFASHRKGFSIGIVGNPGDHPDWLDGRKSTSGGSNLRAVRALATREYPGLKTWTTAPSDRK